MPLHTVLSLAANGNQWPAGNLWDRTEYCLAMFPFRGFKVILGRVLSRTAFYDLRCGRKESVLENISLNVHQTAAVAETLNSNDMQHNNTHRTSVSPGKNRSITRTQMKF